MPAQANSLGDLSRQSPALVRTSAIAAALCAMSLVGLLLDPRELNGAPLWLKPAKFGISTATYLLTLAVMQRDLPEARRLRVVCALIGWLIVLEDVLIVLQAARGQPSHFNVDGPFNQLVFATMGVSIASVWILSIVMLFQHVRTPSRDRAMAMALRFGLALNVIGSAVGWIMVQPRPDQIVAMQQGVHPFRSGAHTVGAPDGGLGMQLTNWSLTHGDLRVPHFIGLHAFQLLPLLVLLLRGVRRRRDDAVERSLLTLATGGCAAVFVSSLIQALQGRPFLPGA